MMALVRAELDPEAQATEALARGEKRRALTVLMEAFGRDIYRHCLAVLGTEPLAQDVHQTVFVQAFRDLGRFREQSSLRTWLFGIARHRCLDALRSRRRFHARFEVTGELGDHSAEGGGPEAHVAASELTRALASALAELKPKIRIAVVLRYHDGLSFEEMAGICGEAPATLQARVARALPHLRQALERAGVRREVLP